jgi:DNA-binding XRE family transcriptional regulator
MPPIAQLISQVHQYAKERGLTLTEEQVTQYLLFAEWLLAQKGEESELLQLRKQCRLTIAEAASTSGVSQGYISMLERDQLPHPNPDKIAALRALYAKLLSS